MKLGIHLAVLYAATALCTGNVSAYTIYGNSASGGNNPLHTIDSVTGVESARFTGQANGNGRGMVVVGDVMYYTVVGDAHIYEVDKNTGVALGSILTQNASMSTIAFDGTYFWTADYAGSNQAFKIDPTTGLNVDTITLSNASSNMDGLEYFNGKLIGNRCDACGVYDIYDLSGNLLTASFISTANGSGTGIAFDGTNFLVSDIFNSKIGIYDGTTGSFLSELTLTSGAGTFLIEDLSVDYATREDTGGGGEVPAIPEPETYALMLIGLGALGLRTRRTKKQN
jgi:hypothetical protein